MTMTKNDFSAHSDQPHEVLDISGAGMKVLSDDHAVFLGDHIVPPGYSVPPHRHEHEDEILFILEGQLTLHDGTSTTKVDPGASVRYGRGVLHGFSNDTQDPVRFLVIATPGANIGEMFRHFDRAGRSGPLTPERIGEISMQYGVPMD